MLSNKRIPNTRIGKHIFLCGAIPTIKTFGYKTVESAKLALNEMNEFYQQHRKGISHSVIEFRYNPFYLILQLLPVKDNDPSESCTRQDITITSAAEIILSKEFDAIFGDYISRYDQHVSATKGELINLINKKYGYFIIRSKMRGLKTIDPDVNMHVLQIYRDVKEFCGLPMVDLETEERIYQKSFLSKLEKYRYATLLHNARLCVKQFGYKTLLQATEAAEECVQIGEQFADDYANISKLNTYYVFNMNDDKCDTWIKYTIKKANRFFNEYRVRELKYDMFKYLGVEQRVTYEAEFKLMVKEKMFEEFGYVIRSSYHPCMRNTSKILIDFSIDMLYEFASGKMYDFLDKWEPK